MSADRGKPCPYDLWNAFWEMQPTNISDKRTLLLYNKGNIYQEIIRGIIMANADPRREVVQKLSRFLTPSQRSTASEQKAPGTFGINNHELETTIEGFRFLREKTIPGVPGRMMLAATNEERAHGQILICYLEQDAIGNWRYSGGASTSLGALSSHPRVHLGGGGWPNHFHVGGYVITNAQDITRVKLTGINGIEVEDTPENGILLFFTDQKIEIPLLAELYDRTGNVVTRHNVFGSYVGN
jgi:hypothetical protein